MGMLELSQLAANIATFLGFPIGVLVLALAARSERRDREFGTYDTLDEKYLDYLRLCAENPKANLYYYEISPEPLSEEETVTRYAIFEVLVSLMERAYLMHKGHRQKMRDDQWSGWEHFCMAWARQNRFRELWAILGDQFDAEFTEFMNRLIASSKPANIPLPASGPFAKEGMR
jgi:hypothetical protein